MLNAGSRKNKLKSLSKGVCVNIRPVKSRREPTPGNCCKSPMSSNAVVWKKSGQDSRIKEQVKKLCLQPASTPPKQRCKTRNLVQSNGPYSKDQAESVRPQRGLCVCLCLCVFCNPINTLLCQQGSSATA